MHWQFCTSIATIVEKFIDDKTFMCETFLKKVSEAKLKHGEPENYGGIVASKLWDKRNVFVCRQN